mgnify:CR=1 FL=1
MLTGKDYCDYGLLLSLVEIGYPKHRVLDGGFKILLYEAQKWLREEKDIHIEVYACAGGYIYELCKAYKPNSFSGGTTIYTPNDVDNLKLNDAGRYDDFETCLSEGIKEAVKLLKEK